MFFLPTLELHFPVQGAAPVISWPLKSVNYSDMPHKPI